MDDDDNPLIVEEPDEIPTLRSRRVERTPELPPRPFLYSLDQISALLYVDLKYLKHVYIYFADRTLGPHHPDLMLARDIAPKGRPPDWRVTEQEFARWLKKKGYRLHQRGWVS